MPRNIIRRRHIRRTFLLMFIAASALAALAAAFALPDAGRAAAAATGKERARDAGAASARLVESYGRLPLRFEANCGQARADVSFLSRGAGYTLLLARDGAVLNLRKGAETPADESGARPPQAEEARRVSTLRFRLAGSNPSSRVVGLGELAGRSNYLVGDSPRSWRVGIENYEKVKYEAIYPGIDLVYYGNEGRLEYDFNVAPGADPSRIRLKFEGARAVRIDEGGDLVLSTEAGDVRQQKPFAYQEAGGRRTEVSARYVMEPGGSVRFALGGYDRRLPLVIDPILVYSSYLGGTGSDQGSAVAVGADGSAYVAGQTASADFPGPSPIQSGKSDITDAFILKLSPDGKSLVYSTYLGGNGDEFANALTVDAAGNAYVSGLTASTNFPRTAGALQETKDGGADAYVAKLNPSGSALVYSTYLGGNINDSILGIAVDSAGNAYVSGRTESTQFKPFTPAGTRGGHPISKSLDGAANWAGSAAGLGSAVVNNFAFHPTDANVVYAATNNGLYKSSDGGANWTQTGTANPSTAPVFTFSVVIDPSNPNVVYAGTSVGVFRSADGGASFEPRTNGVFSIATVLLIDPSAPSTLYAATSSGVFKTVNSGVNWSIATTGLSSGSISISHLAIDPTNPAVLYAVASSRGVFKSVNAAAGWTAINNGLASFGSNPSVRAFAIAPSSPQTLYAVTLSFNAGINKSTDGGANWGLVSALEAIPALINTLAVDPTNANVVYAGTAAGVFKSTDGGANWAQSNNGLASRAIFSLGISPHTPSTVFAGANSGGDAFAAKLNAAGSAVTYFRYLGGSEDDNSRGIAIDAAGNAYVSGTTVSTDFPLAGAFQPSYGGGPSDAFLVKVNAAGSALVYSTYLGGSSTDQGRAVALDAAGSAYVAGQTISSNFPVAAAFQPALANSFDAFVTKFSPAGSTLVYSTYLGGAFSELGQGIAVGPDGSAYVTGSTSSQDFPLVDAIQTTGQGTEAYVARLNPAGSALIFSTYFGGNGTDVGNAVAVDSSGGAYVVGNTSSTNLPTANALRSTPAGLGDAFIAKIGSEADLSLTQTDSRDPVLVNTPLTYNLRVRNNGPSTATGVVLTDTLPAGVTFVSANASQGTCSLAGSTLTCNLGSLAASAEATVAVLVTPTAAGTISNSATVRAADPDANQSNNSSTETTKVSASPSISGRVTGAGGAGMAGITVNLSGSQTASTQTDANGFFLFAELPAGGTYVVTPTRPNFSFEPQSRSFANLSADQTADFTAGACTWTLSPVNQSFGALGGTGTVTITTLRDCPWTATSSADWIRITSGASGTGNGTVTFTVDPTIAPRAGRLTIAGQSFAIYQEFTSCEVPGFALYQYFLPASPTVVKTADLNGDGWLDIVASTTGLQGSNIEASVLLNERGAGFTPRTFGTQQGIPQEFTLDDFTGDGFPDFAITGFGGSSVTIHVNNGAGGFGQSTIVVPFSSQGQSPLPRAVKAADFNKDGKADLLVAAEGNDRLHVLLGNGASGFTQVEPVLIGVFDVLIATADVNADGTPDLIFGGGGSGSPQLSVRLGDGAGGFGAPVVTPGVRAGSMAVSADFDGDGRTDLALPTQTEPTPTNPTPQSTISILLGDGAGRFTVKSSTQASVVHLSVADFNSDAKPDVAYTTGGSKVTFLLGDGAGNLGASVQVDTGASDSTGGNFGSVAADFDRDSKVDLAVADSTRGATVLKNTCSAAPHIWGRVTTQTGLEGVTVTVTGGGETRTAQTDAGGNYFVANLTAGVNYTVTPSKENYRFSPASATVNALTGGRRADFVATPILVQFTQIHFAVDENAGGVQVSVRRTGDTSGTTTVGYTTTGITASDRSDYTAAVGTLIFAPGETLKSFEVLLTDDVLVEGFESLRLVLSSPNGARLGSPSNVLMEIRDNDSTPGQPNPIDRSDFFVRQHYHDFFSRQPDASGLAHWTNVIESCGANAQCREVNRINVSGAFFLSIEFKETGYLVERIYKAAFGDATGTSTLGGTPHTLAVPIIRLEEFLPDTQRIGRGVVVLQGDWQNQLEANKVAFTQEFVQRPRFLEAFPTTLSPAEFVDRLNGRAGGPLDASEHQALIAELTANNTTAGRARALRRVAEDPTLEAAEINRAFVLMQYFGYLRRDPNEGPDTDYTGYDFWLGNLERFNGNFVQAELVKAFISSAEYRQRFGQ